MNKKLKEILDNSINVVSISGGKDSAMTGALALLEWEIPNLKFVTADTGHEHHLTYEYIDYLEDRLGIEIHRVKADFTRQIERKKETIKTKWVEDGAVTESEADELSGLLEPTGIPFLDLCLWKGRFPSSQARFCTEQLKSLPMDMWMLELSRKGKIVSWQGVRAQESNSRSKLSKMDWGEYGSAIYRPILNWTHDDIFSFHKKHDIKPNPLYKMGMGRVGCMPCVMANKNELRQIAIRCPEEVSRVEEWEKMVSMVSKRRNSTFFHAATDPTKATKDNDLITTDSHGIRNIMEWAKTARGGRQYDMLFDSASEVSMCHSVYGLCE